MDGHIDWISFTIPAKLPILAPEQLLQTTYQKLRKDYPNVTGEIIQKHNYVPFVGRAPYRFALANSDRSVRIYGGGSNDTILIEISGRGCDGIRDHALARRICGEFSNRATRLDYAVDIRCRTLPTNFASKRKINTFRSNATIQSDTGETVYLGSPKSDRFARIYRYHHPHPRSELLRVEFVFRRGLARSAVGHLAQSESAQAFIASCGNTWGLDHADWQPDHETNERLKTESRSKTGDKTVSWLYTQVAPAIARLVKEDALSITDFLEHVYSL